MNKRHPQPEFQYSAINKLINLSKLNSITNQISILAGPPKAAKEATQSNMANKVPIPMAAATREESTTGEPREATQQASIQRGFISADASII